MYDKDNTHGIHYDWSEVNVAVIADKSQIVLWTSFFVQWGHILIFNSFSLLRFILFLIILRIFCHFANYEDVCVGSSEGVLQTCKM